MNKNYVLWLTMILILSASAIAMNISSGEINTITTLDKCDGPVLIKITSESGIKDGELLVDKCTTSDNRIWKCECHDSFLIKIKPKIEALNIYDMTIQYYLKYDAAFEGENLTANTQLLKEQNERVKKVIDIFTKEPPTIKSYFRIDVQSKNVVIAVMGITLLLLAASIRWGVNKLKNENFSEKDSLNYATSSEELERIFNKK